MNTKLTYRAMLSSSALLICTTLPFCAIAKSQESSQQSVAEAARRAREQKKPAQKAVKVVTEDDLKPATSRPAAQAAAPQEAAKPPGKAAAQQATAPAGTEKAAAQTKASEKESKEAKIAKLADLKKQLAAAQSDLDLLQREFTLERDTYYSNPDYVHDRDGKAKLDALQSQINDKQQAVEDLKTKVAVLRELLGPDAPEEKPAAPQQP